MELTVTRADLVKELSLGQGVVEKKTTIPVLSNVLVEARDNELTLTVTDLELAIRSQCPAVVAKPGSTTIPAKRLLDYVRLLPDAELAIKVSEKDSVNILCGRAKTRIAGMSRENFPELPQMPAVLTKIPASLLSKVINRTAFSVASEESRYTLTGALLLLKEKSLVMVATDGHRLAYIEAANQFEGVSGEIKALVPKKALGEIAKLAAEAGSSTEIEFGTDENHLFFRCGSRLLITRKLTGQFPDYERVLPSGKSDVVLLNREESAAAVRRVGQFADDRSHAIRIETSAEELKLTSSGSEAGESEESIPISYEGAAVKIGFNSQYLLDFMSIVSSENIELRLTDDESAGELRVSPAEDGYNYRYVVMPMRV